MLNVECAAMIAGCVFRRVQICLDCEGGVGGREKEAASAATGKLKKKKVQATRPNPTHNCFGS